ncbi:hypothetical protein QFK37_004606, partial [Escherichia coli]|nr:hypothetical protein [Escherichia coli]
ERLFSTARELRDVAAGRAVLRQAGLKRGYRLAELVLMHERLARQQVCG